MNLDMNHSVFADINHTEWPLPSSFLQLTNTIQAFYLPKHSLLSLINYLQCTATSESLSGKSDTLCRSSNNIPTRATRKFRPVQSIVRLP